MKSLIIAGSGPAGLTAALYAARANLEPLVLEGHQPGGQLTTTTEVENFPGFPDGIQGPELMERMHAQAARFGATFEPGLVTGSDFQGEDPILILDDGRRLSSRCLILATGASARYLGLESERALIGRGVSSCATCDGAFFRDVPVAVVGGGDSAMEEALFLTRFASRVYVIHRRDALRASPIMAQRAMDHAKIEMLWNSVVEEVLGVEEGKLRAVRLRDVRRGSFRELELSGLFLAIGHTPNTMPFRGQVDMDEAGYVMARNGRTSRAGVFVAGDVQDARYRQAATAAGSGCAAALEAQRYLEEHAG